MIKVKDANYMKNKCYIHYYDTRFDSHMYFIGKEQVLLDNEHIIHKFATSLTTRDYIYYSDMLEKLHIKVSIYVPMHFTQVDYMQEDWACEDTDTFIYKAKDELANKSDSEDDRACEDLKSTDKNSYYIKVTDKSTNIVHYFVSHSEQNLKNNVETIKNYLKAIKIEGVTICNPLSPLDIEHYTSNWGSEPEHSIKIDEFCVK